MAISLARRITRAAAAFGPPPPEAVEKVKLALYDYLSCAFESLHAPQSLAAVRLASRWQQAGGATVLGTPLAVPSGEAAFVNAVLGHGLVREDMHTGSVSHLGVVVFPALLALSQAKPVAGGDFAAAAVCGYEAGAAIGRALMDAETVRRIRPTGVTGPLGAAVAGARMLRLSEDAATSALALAANTTCGLNEWPRTGADDMYFQVGFAARNAVTAVELAEQGVYAAETALDGPAGLFTALGRAERAAEVRAFEGERLAILEVFHKPVGACNYAQTATQAALELAREVASREIAAVRILCTRAALNYPGCDAPGPFTRVLAAKMSIRYCAAAALARGTAAESNFGDLADPEINRLIRATVLEEDPELTRAYPAAQGSEVILTLRDGRQLRRRLADLTPASPEQIRDRYERAASAVLGRIATDVVASMIDTLEQQEEIGVLSALLAAR
jgi:2-methylcitrate dehydratase PrpD